MKIRNLLPNGNLGDFEELPDNIRNGVNASFVSHYEEVLERIF